MWKRKNDVKARITLLLVLPDEHQLGFNKYDSVKELWEAILKNFGGNEATKKTKNNQLKDDLDTISLDDVYDHLKVYEPEVQKRAGSNSQNMAFISSSNTSNGKSEVPIVQGVFTASAQVSTDSINVAAASLCYDTEDEASKNHALVANEEEVPTEYALMAKSSSSSDNEVYDDSFCSKSCRKNTEKLNTKISKLSEELSDRETDLYNYKRGRSSSNVVSKPMIKFVKESSCPNATKVNNIENARKPTVKYAEMYKNTSQSPKGIPQDNIDDKGYWDSGCSRHMTGNISYLSEYEPFNGGYVSFGHGRGKITGDDNHDGAHPETSNTSPPEVIHNGNGHVSIITNTHRMIKVLPPKTTEEIMARERERKARTTLLMALPEDHLAKSHKMADAKEMLEAIESRFSGNDESKKMQQYLLKQQFEGFFVSASKGLHKGYDRIKKFHKRTCRRLQFDTKDPVGFDKTKVECFNFHKMRHFARDCRAKRAKTTEEEILDSSSHLLPCIFYDLYVMEMIRLSLYGTINEEVDVMQPPGFQDSEYPARVYKVEKAMYGLHQAPRACAVKGNGDNAVKASPGCNWRYKRNSWNKVFNYNSGSKFRKSVKDPLGRLKSEMVRVPKRNRILFFYVQDDPHRALKDKGIVDSGCSRYMTGNKDHFADYQEFKGGSVAFGGSNGRITGKGKIKAGRLDFEDVYYVEELKHYNLFFVSQMCNKKNKVLFTDTDCLVLSLDFKLPDENQVLLKIPRQHNMYIFNLKNIDPFGDLACLFTKASIDKSNKWHIREQDMHGCLILILTNFMNYGPVLVENQANKSARPNEANNSTYTQANDDQNNSSEESDLHEEHFVLPIWKEATHDIQNASTSSTNLINTASTPLSIACPLRAFNNGELSFHDDPLMPHLEDIYASLSEGIFTDSFYDDEGVVTDFNNVETTVSVSLTPTIRIHTIHPKTQILRDPMSPVQTMSKVNKNAEARALNSWCDEFEELMKNGFQMSYMGELNFFLGLQFKKKEDAVKRIFRYLKDQPKLGLWYPKVSSFDLEGYSDSDYAGVNLDRKSITRGCQFLSRRLISWQCKKQTIVSTSTTEAEYVAAAHCCG
nr:ribonuclease H-like domain-containing protein [Tanacetum cinerariifolium]